VAHEVVVHPLARADLFDLYDYIEKQSGPGRAASYVRHIENVSRTLAAFPERGRLRSDIGPGIRTIALERRVLIVLRVDSTRVEILRVLYAGRDFRSEDVPAL
jgi:toxin ParE1/3/4